MKIVIGMLLAILILLAGCAQGYYSQGPPYQEEETTHLIKSPFTNPETSEEESQRIWREESRQPF
jgi:hypothetical protein